MPTKSSCGQDLEKTFVFWNGYLIVLMIANLVPWLIVLIHPSVCSQLLTLSIQREFISILKTKALLLAENKNRYSP